MREFNYKGQPIRVVPIKNRPWLALADVCRVLQLGSTTKAAANISEIDKRFELIRNRRSAQKMIVISENGFHTVIAHSRNTKAKEFEHWIDCNVFSEPKQTSELQVFENEEIGTQLRGLMIDGEPWFVAADVCKALEIQNTTQAVAKLDEDEKAMLNIGLSGGATNCVNEYGLYNLILGSRKPEAKSFKRWVTHEVLPSIRKIGKYETTAKAQVQPSVEAGIQKVGLLVRDVLLLSCNGYCG